MQQKIKFILIGIVTLLVLTNPSDDSLKNKVESKSYDGSTTVFSTSSIVHIDKTNYLIFSLASVETLSNVGGYGIVISSTTYKNNYLGIAGNWFRLQK